MNNRTIEEINERVNQLEHLAWSLFRALETYITYNELGQGCGEDALFEWRVGSKKEERGNKSENFD